MSLTLDNETFKEVKNMAGSDFLQVKYQEMALIPKGPFDILSLACD